MLKYFPLFMNTDSMLLCSNMPATGQYVTVLKYARHRTVCYCAQICPPTDSMLLCSNMPATGQYPHAAEFGPCLRTHFLKRFFFPVAFRPDTGSWSLLMEIRDHNHWTQDTRQDSSARVISPSQRTLTTHNTHKR